jgi:hypothetical protein
MGRLHCHIAPIKSAIRALIASQPSFFSTPKTAKDIRHRIVPSRTENVATAIRELVAESVLVKVKGGYVLP